MSQGILVARQKITSFLTINVTHVSIVFSPVPSVAIDVHLPDLCSLACSLLCVLSFAPIDPTSTMSSSVLETPLVLRLDTSLSATAKQSCSKCDHSFFAFSIISDSTYFELFSHVYMYVYA